MISRVFNLIHHSEFINQEDYLGINIFWSLFSEDAIKDCLRIRKGNSEGELSEVLPDAVVWKIIFEGWL